MSDRDVIVCGECDSTHITLLRHGAYCNECAAHVETMKRPLKRLGHQNGISGTARKLLDMDPDEVRIE